MIRDFFIALIAVTVLEMVVRLGIVYYKFETKDERITESVAERLASDLKDVMLNAGGPVAGRTIYPTWQRNFRDLGLEIALIPSHVTKTSIPKTYNFEPKGIPPNWSKGRHHEATMALHAEPFCVTCHIDAQPGDELGRVVVRSYLSARMKAWWEEVSVLSIVGMVNIIVHTMLLFVLLKARMEPLLELRSQVAALARGRFNLGYRAAVRSDDEFGALAADLNHFLDRITHLIEDLDQVLTRMIAAKHRVDQVCEQINDNYAEIRDRTQQVVKQALDLRESRAIMAQEVAETVELMDLLGVTLHRLGANGALPEDFSQRVGQVLLRLKATARAAQSQSPDKPLKTDALLELSHHVNESSHFLKSMALLQERMEVIAETGQTLLTRLTGQAARAAEREAEVEPIVAGTEG